MASDILRLGDVAPSFSLSNVDGRIWSLADLAEKSVVVVIFSCNHCPYVQAYEDRMVAIQREYAEHGVQLVAINSNDADDYPEDSFVEMKKRAQEKGFNFLYLRDDSQTTARAYGATHTPQLFVFDRDRRLRYMGKIDDNWQQPQSVRRRFLRDALDALLAGGQPVEPMTHAIGCTIKWQRS